MITEQIWREPWKKKEPQNRLSEKEKTSMEKSVAERASMEKRSIQHVIVKFNKYLIPKEMFYNFTVNMKIPLRRTEIIERMAAAFPDIPIEES